MVHSKAYNNNSNSNNNNDNIIIIIMIMITYPMAHYDRNDDNNNEIYKGDKYRLSTPRHTNG